MSSMNQFIDRINHRTGGLIDIIKYTSTSVNRERAAEGAASMAYYSFFSLFPLLLVIIVVVSTVLENTLTQEQVLQTLLQAFPFSRELIEENMRKVLGARGTVGVIGLVGLTWSATGAFTVLTRNINRAWPNTKLRNIFRMRLVSLTMVIAMIIGLISLFVFNTVVRYLPQDVNAAAEKATSYEAFPYILIWLLLFTTLMLLYWWLPRTRVYWTEAAWGALLGSVGVSGITNVFTWYLDSGLSNYNLVYGSLGTIVALLFWIYLLSLIIFIGAHLSAAVAVCRRPIPLSPTPDHSAESNRPGS